VSERPDSQSAAAPTVSGRAVESGFPKWQRTVQRYLLPGFLRSLIILLRDGALVSISSRVQVSSRVRLGKKTVVKPYSIVQSSGGRIDFGRNCAVSSFNHIATGETGQLVVGDHVRTGPHVTIIATTREYRNKDKLIVEQGYKDKGIRIGNDVLIGAGAVLVDGCDIGDGAVIGVNSVVTGTVPPHAVVFGAPAKVIYWRR
jgi:acetyltransferase-like isoleucine patch superfamily enzyme